MRADDVRRALKLLERAKLAEPDSEGNWNVGWEELPSKEATCSTSSRKESRPPPKSGPIARLRRREAANRSTAGVMDDRPMLFS